MRSVEDLIDGLELSALSASGRVLIWAFRNVASGRGCDARLAMGLSSVVEPGRALECARIVRLWLEAVTEASRRDMQFGGLPHRGLTWDEIALLTAIAAGAGNAIGYALWWRRLGCKGPPAQRLAAIAIARFLGLQGAVPQAPGVTSPAIPRHEPEVLARNEAAQRPRTAK